MFTVDADYAGGNIRLYGQEGDTVHVAPDLRDTEGSWFYYNFRVRGAEGRTLTFCFDEPIVPPFGPAVSIGGAPWRFLPERVQRTERSFVFSFGPEEGCVRFAFSLPYQLRQLQERLAGYRHVEAGTLCLSEKGRPVPVLSAGDGALHVVLSCRHHCCESAASYVLEGMLDAIDADVRLRGKFSFLVLPFADLDGVEEGDQGKNRRPHDHNRDYTEAPIYAAVRAWTAKVRAFAPCAALDLHDPWRWGGVNDHLSLIHNRYAGPALDAFARTLDGVTASSFFRHEEKWDIRWNAGWNTEANGQDAAATSFYSRCGAKVACSVEIPYFGVSVPAAEDFRRLGRDLLEALDRSLS